jgi:hypothetical protein
LYNQDFGFEWQNKLASLALKHRWNERLSSNLSVSKGSYSTNQFTINASDAFSYTNGISYLKGLLNNTFTIGENHYIKGGVEYIKYDLDPERLAPNDEMSIIQDTSIQRLGSLSIAPYLGGKVSILKNLAVEAGVRYTTYTSTGPGTIYSYVDDLVTSGTILNSIEINGRKRISTFSLI